MFTMGLSNFELGRRHRPAQVLLEREADHPPKSPANHPRRVMTRARFVAILGVIQSEVQCGQDVSHILKGGVLCLLF